MLTFRCKLVLQGFYVSSSWCFKVAMVSVDTLVFPTRTIIIIWRIRLNPEGNRSEKNRYCLCCWCNSDWWTNAYTQSGNTNVLIRSDSRTNSLLILSHSICFVRFVSLLIWTKLLATGIIVEVIAVMKIICIIFIRVAYYCSHCDRWVVFTTNLWMCTFSGYYDRYGLSGLSHRGFTEHPSEEPNSTHWIIFYLVYYSLSRFCIVW